LQESTEKQDEEEDETLVDVDVTASRNVTCCKNGKEEASLFWAMPTGSSVNSVNRDRSKQVKVHLNWMFRIMILARLDTTDSNSYITP
jgi:hypothetical protein